LSEVDAKPMTCRDIEHIENVEGILENAAENVSLPGCRHGTQYLQPFKSSSIVSVQVHKCLFSSWHGRKVNGVRRFLLQIAEFWGVIFSQIVRLGGRGQIDAFLCR
jgi:hypothetical protein